MHEPSLRDMCAGIGTAILAAAVMLIAALVPLLLITVLIKQGAGLLIAGVVVAAGVFILAFRRMRAGQHYDYAHRRR